MTNLDKAREIGAKHGIGNSGFDSDIIDAIKEMAEWKDQQHAKECESLVGLAVKEARQVFIDKACEWLEKYMESLGYIDEWCRNGEDDFRKAMTEKTNPLFEQCLANVNPEIRAEVRRNMDAALVWHKVSEELPKVDKYRKCIKVFARKGDDVFVAFYSIAAGFSLSSSFYTEYALSGVTHWMEIPEIKED